MYDLHNWIVPSGRWSTYSDLGVQDFYKSSDFKTTHLVDINNSKRELIFWRFKTEKNERLKTTWQLFYFIDSKFRIFVSWESKVLNLWWFGILANKCNFAFARSQAGRFCWRHWMRLSSSEYCRILTKI